jgi:glutamate-1-semialdehyde 2,1-aminomutase
MDKLILNENYYNKLCFSSAKGSELYLNKKKLLDLSSAGGTLLLGHNSSIFKSSLKEFLDIKASNFAAPNKYAIDFSNNLKSIFKNYNKFIFCNSGAEANLKMLRIVRAITKKKIVISITGSWHGSVDELLYFPSGKNKQKLSDGLVNENKKNLIFAPYNEIDKTIKILTKFSNKICCVLVEPIQACLPSINSLNYLRAVQRFCKKKNIILVFDEIITGLRNEKFSVENKFKLDPDIAIYGKALGGGLPLGIIALKKKIFFKIKKKKLNIFFGGTFSANSLSMHIANRTLEYLIYNKKKVFNQLKLNTFYFYRKIESFIKNKKIDAKLYYYESLFRIVFTSQKINNRVQRDFLEKNRKGIIEKFKKFMFNNNIYYPINGICFISFAHKKEQLDFIAKKICEGLEKFIK